MSSVATRLPRMSFIGRRPIIFKNSEVTFSIQQLSNAAQSIRNLKFGTLPFTQTALVSGRLGAFHINITDGLDCKLSEAFTPEETKICLSVNAEKYLTMNKYQQKFLRSMYGTTNSILARFIEGVSEGHQTALQLVGVGYKASVELEGVNQSLNLRLGYSHPVILPVPNGIQAKSISQTKLILSGADYQKLTQFAAKIRAFRPPEPYNGKGIFVDDEKVIRKEGKKSK